MNIVLLKLIMGWMVAITGYANPISLPDVQFRPHSFFVENVCGGQECPAMGWYNDSGVIYIDKFYKMILAENSYPDEPDQVHAEAVSLLGHEVVHYLQDRSGKFKEKTCKNFLDRDEEAFRAQRIGMLPYLKFLIQRPIMYRPYRCPYEK